MRAQIKCLVIVGAIVALGWAATPYLGRTRLKSQVEEEETKTFSKVSRPVLESVETEIDILHASAPFYFEAHVVAKSRLIGDRGAITRGYERTGSYLYTPWRAYLLKVHSDTIINQPEPNQALQHNDPSCHGSCFRTLRASRGRG